MIGIEGVKVGEALFKPANMEIQSLGIHEAAAYSFFMCDGEKRKSIDSIVLSGGNTMFSGIEERMQKEIRRLLPYNTEIKALVNQDVSPIQVFFHLFGDSSDLNEFSLSFVIL